MIEPRGGHHSRGTRLPSRLSARLGRSTPLTVVRAPHGFGKSALAAAWALSAADADRTGVLVSRPVPGIGSEQFWQHTAAHLVAAGVLDAEHRAGGWTYPAIRDALVRTGRPVRLALDRVDLAADPELEKQVLELVDDCDSVDVVATVVGRSTFGDPLALGPTHDVLCGDDLLLTLDDLGEVFATDGAELDNDTQLTDDQIHLVHRLTGGMHSLVAIAREIAGHLTDPEVRPRLLEPRLTQAISQYVRTTLLDAPDVTPHRGFLVDTATAHTVTVETARFLGASEDPAGHLEALEATGVADRRETDRGPEWQVPTAVRRELRTIQREDGMDPSARSTRLALRQRDRADFAAAVLCATEAQNWPLAVDLVEEHWLALIGTHLDLLRDMLSQLPEEFLDAHPGFREGRELAVGLGGDARPGGSLSLDPDELRLLGSVENVGLTIGVLSHRTLMQRLAGRYETAADSTRRLCRAVDELLEAHPDDLADFLPFLRMQWGLTFQLAGDFSESSEMLRLAYLLGSARGLDYISRNAAGNSALNWALAGEPGRVHEWLERELAHPPTEDAVESLIEIGGLTARALTALDRLDVVAAATALGQLDELPVVAELWPFVVYARCRHAVAAGEPSRALEALALFTEEWERAEGNFVRSLLTAAEIEAHLADGNGSRAYLLATRAPGDHPWSVVAAARTHLITGNYHAAINTARRYDWFATPYTRSHLEALVIESAAQHALGRSDRAAQLWRRVCELADRTQILAAFAGIQRELVIALDASVAVPSTSVDGFLATDVADHYPQSLSHPELTDREKAVLDGLADGHTASAIADALFVSLSTVKSHRTSLYRKLGAHSRRDAVAIAREFGLLPVRASGDGQRRKR
ncbi:LuxR C-terminal-related transcriptional regulator [Rhodococcus sp. ACT016]|uniref:helix-turn-helix transcriptional regulator n=1 Tax=Rhodococcus sp. ACT016 TaxID=3134808 RepID=UPI003D2E8E9F